MRDVYRYYYTIRRHKWIKNHPFGTNINEGTCDCIEILIVREVTSNTQDIHNGGCAAYRQRLLMFSSLLSGWCGSDNFSFLIRFFSFANNGAVQQRQMESEEMKGDKGGIVWF